ncbi:MAG TPA: NADP-dependent oxidoreductase [Candidatus Binatia bacterium]|jgi:NADPH:quinone reductase-like Zn-dependent oxidoreductase|nr:NADP-dependent oxidoreductase [Candidatus Binatia bacterium]
MKAGRIHHYGPPSAISIDEIGRPTANVGELVVRVAAAGVGPWDALIREGKSVVQLSLPIILGSDLAGIVESVGTGVIQFKPGDEVFGVTNKQFCGAYAEYAVASAQMVASRPRSLSFVESASVPVVAVTAYQMLFDYARLKAGQSVLIHGAAGNVGAYAVQLAKRAQLQVFATAGPADLDYVRGLGAEKVINHQITKFEDAVPPVDAVLDTVGGETQHRSFSVLKPGGILVSSVSPPPQSAGVRSTFLLVDVTAARLDTLSKLFDRQELTTQVGTVLPLEEARRAHEMLAGAPHKRGKIVLAMG